MIALMNFLFHHKWNRIVHDILTIRLNMYLTLFTEILLFYFKLCYFFFLIVYVLFKTEILERIS